MLTWDSQPLSLRRAYGSSVAARLVFWDADTRDSTDRIAQAMAKKGSKAGLFYSQEQLLKSRERDEPEEA